jgi:hypothetical protein
MKTSVLSVALIWLLSLSALAFPPAPGFTVFGIVRDEYGWAVNSSLARIKFKNAGTGALISEAPVGASGSLIENYRLTLPMDHNRTGAVYRANAIKASAAFSIEVVINNVTYYPTPVTPPPSTSVQAAEFLQLDLMLGDDSDADGLPDLWEQWQLEAAGLDPNRIDFLGRTDDPDGDGMSNLDEFIGGTFAFLGFDSLSLKFVEITADTWSRMEFLAVIDKTYVLERSIDMQTWEPAPFGLNLERNAMKMDWQAPDTIRQTIQSPPGPIGQRWFYKMSVR